VFQKNLTKKILHQRTNLNYGQTYNYEKQTQLMNYLASNQTATADNYRHISILPAVSKILERLMYNKQISFLDKYNKQISFLDKYNILAKQQFGFRKGRSTEHVVVHLVDYITNCFDKKQSVFGIFF
jgi:hypothetical protein